MGICMEAVTICSGKPMETSARIFSLFSSGLAEVLPGNNQDSTGKAQSYDTIL
jgi:hypothetical protein